MLLIIILLSFCLRTINTLQCVEEFCIGTLFDIRDPISPYEPMIKCKNINEIMGIQRIEAALSAIKSVNEYPDILPGIYFIFHLIIIKISYTEINLIITGVTLGLNIEDTCRIPNLALYKALLLIKDVRIHDMYGVSEKEYESKISEVSSDKVNSLYV